VIGQIVHAIVGRLAARQTPERQRLRDQVTALGDRVRQAEAAADDALCTLQAVRDSAVLLERWYEAEREQTAAEHRQALEAADRQTADARRRAGEAEAARDGLAAELRAVTRRHHATSERYYAALAGVPGIGGFTDAELVDALRAGGVPASLDDRVTLHVGFGHSATTSLQHAYFAGRDEVFYPGLPYGDAGGFFSYLKYTEDHRLDPAEMLRLCRDTVYAAPGRRGRPVVVSDEMFTEPAEVYYHPHVLPGPQVAARLKRYFPTAKVVFTVRRQPEYVASLYFNLKRNYAYLAGMPVPPFAEWWDGVMHSQVRGPYLLNLDYAPLVRVYADLFGPGNVLVLPLEELKDRGAGSYLGRLCGFVGVPLRDDDLDRFCRPRNARMSVVEARVADLLAARQADAAVRQALANEALAGLTGQASPASLDLGDEVADEICRLVAPGNRWLAETFGLPLGEWGYFV
jgi:hypothetical protein